MPPAEQTAVMVVKTYDFKLLLLPNVEKFNRAYRFRASDRLVSQDSRQPAQAADR